MIRTGTPLDDISDEKIIEEVRESGHGRAETLLVTDAMKLATSLYVWARGGGHEPEVLIQRINNLVASANFCHRLFRLTDDDYGINWVVLEQIRAVLIDYVTNQDGDRSRSFVRDKWRDILL